jgi:hypothetical protein
MPLTDDQRREYMRLAGLTDKQIEESIGDFPVDKLSISLAKIPPTKADSAAKAVRQLQADATIISAKYNRIQGDAKRDAREVTAAAELTNDRKLLDELIGDDYRLVNPFGKSEGKAETINKILSGTIKPETFGVGGFEARETSLKVHGEKDPHTVVLHGRFFMKGAGLAKFKKSGAVRWRNLTGEYRSTHTFVLRDGRWQMTATHMTQVPQEPDFVFVGEND